MNAHRMAYIGQRLTDKGTLKPFYQDCDTGQVRGFKNALISGNRIGLIIQVHEHPDGGWYISGDKGPQAVGQRSEADATVWAGQEAADRVLHARMLQQKRAVAETPEPFREALDVLREAYRGTTGIGRRAALIDYITTAIQS